MKGDIRDYTYIKHLGKSMYVGTWIDVDAHVSLMGSDATHAYQTALDREQSSRTHENVQGEVSKVTDWAKIWKGEAFALRKIFVLGESWYGDYSDDLITDDGYVRAYLAGQVVDSLYSRIANACQLSRQDFWQGVMFTNFVQRVGATRAARPTVEHYREAGTRLARLLVEHQPLGVWILGIGQGEYSAPVVERAGIPFEVTAHPTSYGVKSATLYASWNALLAKARNYGASR